MPIYEFHCPACDHEFEELVGSAYGAGDIACPKCAATGATRRFSVFAARSAAPASGAGPLPPGACGRCGDPNGPCSGA